MKTKLHHWKLGPFLAIAVLGIAFTACDDDEKPKTAPIMTTGAVSDITPTSASGAGEISSDGNAGITASGLCWSSANLTPTIEDDTTMTATSMGSFTSLMEGLTPSTTYYVRAYATNSVGTAYGDVVDFTTGNAAPIAMDVSITGIVQVLEELTATYAYSDPENDAENGSTFKWYRADDAAGTGEQTISGATALTYTVQEVDEFKFIRFGVTPVASAGNTTGAEVKSVFVGPVAEEPTAVTFMYNGESVEYGIIISPVTGRRWLDRNLGAPNVATAYNDFANYGDAFQWGRLADGHQLVNRAATSGATAGVNGTTTTLSTTDIPGHALFISNSNVTPFDWRSPQNDNLWQGLNGINNPCPTGWRMPDSTEWVAENLVFIQDAYNQLKLTMGGTRSGSSGNFLITTSTGTYWSSTIQSGGVGAVNFKFSTSGVAPAKLDARAAGALCRCIKD